MMHLQISTWKPNYIYLHITLVTILGNRRYIHFSGEEPSAQKGYIAGLSSSVNQREELGPELRVLHILLKLQGSFSTSFL